LSKNAKDLIDSAHDREKNQLRRMVEIEKQRVKALYKALETIAQVQDDNYEPIPVTKKARKKRARYKTRVIIPDSHGEHIDLKARDAFLNDLDLLQVNEVVWIGDHLDCAGTFSVHQRNYTHELTESYSADIGAANDFIDQVQKRSPEAVHYYLEGNHEHHIERWAARQFHSAKDAELAVSTLGPVGVLHLKKRGIKYFRQGETYMGLTIPGTIKLGKCYFTHGFSVARHSAFTHLLRVGDNVVFGHTHSVQTMVERTVSSKGQGAWSYGTLAKLQPLYKHTNPTSWVHAYGLQFVHQDSGTFVSIPIPIVGNKSLLENVVDGIKHT